MLCEIFHFVVKTILKQLGKNENLIKFVGDRSRHDLRYAIDSYKVEKEQMVFNL